MCKLFLSAIIMAMVCWWVPFLHGGSVNKNSQTEEKRPDSQSSLFAQEIHLSEAPTLLAQAGRARVSSTGEPSTMQAKITGKSPTNTETVVVPDRGEFQLLSRDPLDLLQLDNIKPLYTSPAIPGEGVWESSGSPRDPLGKPIVYKTFYRPSVDFPNAMVYMMVVDMGKAFLPYLRGVSGARRSSRQFRGGTGNTFTHFGRNQCNVDATSFSGSRSHIQRKSPLSNGRRYGNPYRLPGRISGYS